MSVSKIDWFRWRCDFFDCQVTADVIRHDVPVGWVTGFRKEEGNYGETYEVTTNFCPLHKEEATKGRNKDDV